VALAGKGDLTSEVYIERCDVFLQTPPPADWDGVYEMTTK
jgi:adenylate cyclase